MKSNLWLAAFAFFALQAQAETATEIQAYMDSLGDQLSGVVLVAKDGVPVASKAAGLAKKTAHKPIDLETKFNLGSLNKMFTSVAIAQLAQAWRLRFDDPIAKHLPDYPNKEVAQKVTIHHLLTHTSGLGSWSVEAFRAQREKLTSVAAHFPLFVNEPLTSAPGERFQYSNAGFMVLGAIIEKISGQDYYSYVRDHIYRPAGMLSTDFYESGKEIPNLAIGYTRMGPDGKPGNETTENTDRLEIRGGPAGGGYSTAGDLLKFHTALRTYKLLDRTHTELITTGKVDTGGPIGRYAYGFGDKVIEGKRIVSHNGGWPGVAANFEMYPDSGYTAIILMNGDPPAMMPVVTRLRQLIPANDSLGQSALSDFVGRYGNKEITVEGETLHYQRLGGSGATLRAKGKDVFALNEDATITFQRDARGEVVEMAIDWVNQEDQKYPREPLKPESPLDASTTQQLQAIMTHLFETIYVSPEIGKRLAQQLRTKFESGDYREADTRAKLAEQLTLDLREWSHDKHLSVRYDPANSAEETILTPAAWSKQRASMFREPTRQPQMDERMAERLKADNYHFRQAKMLEGKIGYFELGGFAPGEAAREKAAETMALLADSETMIIDLRDCPGGSVEMINFLASYFFGPEPRVLMNRYIRPTNERIQSKTLAKIPGKRMPDVDLYILVGPKTVSAGESFAFTLQQWGRAKIVGEKTAGAGYNNVIIPLGQGLNFSISYGRPEHPRTGKGWQEIGVQPDIPVPVGEALEAAQKAALQKKEASRVILRSTIPKQTPPFVCAALHPADGRPRLTSRLPYDADCWSQGWRRSLPDERRSILGKIAPTICSQIPSPNPAVLFRVRG